MTKTISAAANPALANQLLNEATQEIDVPEIDPTIVPPSDNTVELPGGYITAAGEVVRIAEVRELNGRDEEAIAKATNIAKAFLILLQRGTVKIGDLPVTDKILDELLSGDRDTLLLGILKNTFGSTVEVGAYCSGCNDVKTVAIDINTDIKIKILTDPINDRMFTVSSKLGEVTVQLPTGVTQKELINNADKSSAELNTILLENTVTKINGAPVYSKAQVQNLGIVDRKKIIEQINKRIPGPQFDDVEITCPECESEVTVALNLATLFQL
jgi:hypothetical protein